MSAASPSEVFELKAELSSVIHALGASTQRLHEAETGTILDDEGDPDPDQEVAESPLEVLVRSVRDSIHQITLSVLASDREAFTHNSKSDLSHIRVFLLIIIRKAISEVNTIIVKFAGVVSDEARTNLRQIIVTFITVSKNRFVKPHVN